MEVVPWQPHIRTSAPCSEATCPPYLSIVGRARLTERDQPLEQLIDAIAGAPPLRAVRDGLEMGISSKAYGKH